MHDVGHKPDEVEVGNLWEMRCREIPATNWVVGTFPSIPEMSLRFMRQTNTEHGVDGATAKDICLKWFVHSPDDPEEWGQNKKTSDGRTMSILVDSGEFKMVFIKNGEYYTATLDTPGDFAIWGPGLDHSWKPMRRSTIITLRWIPQ